MDQAINKISMTRQVKSCMLDSYKAQWVQTVNRDQSARSTGGNKLRKYRLLNVHGKREKNLSNDNAPVS